MPTTPRHPPSRSVALPALRARSRNSTESAQLRVRSACTTRVAPACSASLPHAPGSAPVHSGSAPGRCNELHAATHGSVHSGCTPQSSERSAVLLVYSRNSACPPCRCGYTPPHSASAPRLLRVAPPCSGPAPHPLRIAPRPLRTRSASLRARSAPAPCQLQVNSVFAPRHSRGALLYSMALNELGARSDTLSSAPADCQQRK